MGSHTKTSELEIEEVGTYRYMVDGSNLDLKCKKPKKNVNVKNFSGMQFYQN